MTGRRLLGTLALFGTASVLAPSMAAAQSLRFSDTLHGGIVVTGNALGLSKAIDANGPGIADSIGTFMSLSPTDVDDTPANASNPWFAGTTGNWTANGSEAMLSLPGAAVVERAELVWGGSYSYVEDVSDHLDDAVTLRFEGQELSVSPDGTTAVTLSQVGANGLAVRFYLRSADVTEFVSSHGAGRYGLSGVPATQSEAVNGLNAAGWSLFVVYSSPDAPLRNVSILVGGNHVDEENAVDYGVPEVCAPTTGEVVGIAAVSALEGDANLTGDVFQIGDGSAAFVSLSTPNNPASNFFASQINGASGTIDPVGTFGDRNHDAVTGSNTVGARQGWDVTTVQLSSSAGQLTPGQTSVVLRAATAGDSYVPAGVGFQLDTPAPDFQFSTAQTSVASASLGELIRLAVTLDNFGGDVDADNVTFSLPLETGLRVEDFQLDGVPGDVGGAPVTALVLASGVAVGDIQSGDSIQVDIDLRVEGSASDGQAFQLAPSWSYDFTTCGSRSDSASLATTTVDWLPAAGTGGAAGAGGVSGAAGAAAGAGGIGGEAAHLTGGTGNHGSGTGGTAAGAGGIGVDSGGIAGADPGGAPPGDPAGGDPGLAGHPGTSGATHASAGSSATTGGAHSAGNGSATGGTTTGGTNQSSAGNGGATTSAGSRKSDDDGGCGCRTTGSRPRTSLAWVMALLLAAWRRRNSKACPSGGDQRRASS